MRDEQYEKILDEIKIQNEKISKNSRSIASIVEENKKLKESNDDLKMRVDKLEEIIKGLAEK